MNNKKIAKALLKAAKDLISIEFDTTDALKEYLKEHPGADKSRHKVKKTDNPKSDGGSSNTKLDKTGVKKLLDTSGFSELSGLVPSAHLERLSKKLENGDIEGFKTGIEREIEYADDKLDHFEYDAKRNARTLNQALKRENQPNAVDNIDNLSSDEIKSFLEKINPLVKNEKVKNKIDSNLYHLENAKKTKETYERIKNKLPEIEEKLQGDKPKKTPLPRKQKEKLEALNKHAESGNTEMVKDTIQSLKNDINLNDVTPEQAEVLKKEISKARETLTKKQPNIPTLPKNDVLNKKAPVNKDSLKKVNNVLKSNKIDEDSDELKELSGFKKTLGQRVPEADKGKWFVRNEQKLKKDFIKNMDPSNYSSPEAFKNARQRIMDMPTNDFGKVLAAIGEEEEE